MEFLKCIGIAQWLFFSDLPNATYSFTLITEKNEGMLIKKGKKKFYCFYAVSDNNVWTLRENSDLILFFPYSVFLRAILSFKGGTFLHKKYPNKIIRFKKHYNQMEIIEQSARDMPALYIEKAHFIYNIIKQENRTIL